MKKSCSTIESKVVTTKDAKNVLNASKEESQESNLTEEQILINKKLLESGIKDEGLGWLEKTNIFNTINVSLNTAGSEKLQRSSPRLAKSVNTRAAKWVENSFETPKHEDSLNLKVAKTKSNKDSEVTPAEKLSPVVSIRKFNPEAEEFTPKSSNRSEQSNSQRDVDGKSDSPKSSKKIHYIKVQVEENSKEECNSSAEGVGSGLSLGKKRASQPELFTVETPKKLKMDETNNGVSSEEDIPLQVELEMEKIKCSEPFTVRDIKTIVSECEFRNRKWKETYSKYKCPTRWGTPIVRNCSEKWDGKQIPPKLLHRFQKYLSANDITHPIFLPVKLQSNMDSNKYNSEISSQSSTGTINEGKLELEDDKDSGEGLFVPREFSRSGSENNLNASTSGNDTCERMVLRNRSQQKTVISDEEEFSSDDSDDWLVKQKSTKKQRFNAKNKKVSDQSNKQLVLKLEKCNINKGNGYEGGRRNSNKGDIGFSGGSIMSPSALNPISGNSKSGPDPDTMICPICSLRFKKQLIESHATECASKTYKD